MRSPVRALGGNIKVRVERMGGKTEKFDAFFILTYVAQLEDVLSTSYINGYGVLMTAQTPSSSKSSLFHSFPFPGFSGPWYLQP